MRCTSLPTKPWTLMEVGCAAIEAFQGMPFPGSFLNPRNLGRFSFNLSIPFSLESTVHWTPTTCFTRYFLFFTSLIVRVETKYHFQRYSYIYMIIIETWNKSNEKLLSMILIFFFFSFEWFSSIHRNNEIN